MDAVVLHSLYVASSSLDTLPRSKILRQYADPKHTPKVLRPVSHTGFQLDRSKATDCDLRALLHSLEGQHPDTVLHVLQEWVGKSRGPAVSSWTPLNSDEHIPSRGVSLSSGSSSSLCCPEPTPCDADLMPSICCTGWDMRREKQVADDNPCFLLGKHLSKNDCCGNVATLECVLCGEAFCDMPGCSKSAKHNHTGRRNLPPPIQRLRCSCPQLLRSGAVALQPHVYRCEGCFKATCPLCLDKVVAVVVIENIPNTWTDGVLLEALELALQARVVEYARSFLDGHAYLQFDRQVLRLGTQCIKLHEVDGNAVLQLKPPHVPRRLPKPVYHAVVVDVAGIDGHTEPVAVLPDLAKACKVGLSEIYYAVSVRPDSLRMLIEVADVTVVDRIVNTKHFTHEDTLFPYSTVADERFLSAPLWRSVPPVHGVHPMHMEWHFSQKLSRFASNATRIVQYRTVTE